MQNRTDTQEVKTTPAQLSHSRLPALDAQTFTRFRDNNIGIKELTNGDIAVVCHGVKPFLKIFNADLTECKIEHPLEGKFQRFIMCPNGDVTANSVEHKYNRVLLDAYTLEVKQVFNHSINDNRIAKNIAFDSACPISDKHYIIVRSAGVSLDAIRVYDNDTHECKATIDIEAKLPVHAKYRRITTAVYLQNNITALVLDDTGEKHVVLFKYQDEKLSDVKLLDFAGLVPEHTAWSVELSYVSDDRLLTMISYKHHQGKEQTLLQLWDTKTGKKIDTSVKMDGFYMDPQQTILSDGTLVCLKLTGHNRGKIAAINSQSLTRSHFVTSDRAICNLVVLADDRVVIVSKPMDWFMSTMPQAQFSLGIVDIMPYLGLDFKKPHLVAVIADAVRCASLDLVNMIAGYVGNAFSFPKTDLRCGLFRPMPKTVDDKIISQIKLFDVTLKQLINFFNKHNVTYLPLLVEMRAGLKEAQINTVAFENNLRVFCQKVQAWKGLEHWPMLQKTVGRLQQLRMDIEVLRGEKVEAEKSFCLTTG